MNAPFTYIQTLYALNHEPCFLGYNNISRSRVYLDLMGCGWRLCELYTSPLTPSCKAKLYDSVKTNPLKSQIFYTYTHSQRGHTRLVILPFPSIVSYLHHMHNFYGILILAQSKHIEVHYHYIYEWICSERMDI